MYMRDDLSNEPKMKTMRAYFCEMAKCSSLHSDDGTILLAKAFENAVRFIPENSLLAQYWDSKRISATTTKTDFFIFPFGANRSQIQAVRNAIQNPCSIIEGPPGTGKTQTILNIIANLLIRNQKTLVVSNNNAALQNIIDKLEKYELDFLSAFLGSRKNKERFFADQSSSYPDMSSWECPKEEQDNIKTEIQQLIDHLMSLFETQERLAKLEQQISDLHTEEQHFIQSCADYPMEADEWEIPSSLTFEVAIKVLKKIQASYAAEERIPLWYRVVCAFLYHIGSWNRMKKSPLIILRFLYRALYPLLFKKLEREREEIIHFLQNNNVQALLGRFSSLSLRFLRGCLFEKLHQKQVNNQGRRRQFNIKSYGWDQAEAFICEYPIVLSTTFSSSSCIWKNAVRFDMLIMDEASQVDIVQGAMALTTSKKAVIVGDTKQLPNVLSQQDLKNMKELYEKYSPGEAYYNREGNSFLASFRTVFANAPSVILREHYRCHPDIIGFCNERFYHGQLVVMTQDMMKNDSDALRLYRTSEGHHAYHHVNQRQIEVMEKEALPELKKEIPDEEIGIIAPYRNQVNAMDAVNGQRNAIDTVHKFQGKEKEAILFVSTDDKASSFLDQPSLINVAVSRAKKKFWLIASKEEPSEGSLLGELIRYIEYKNSTIIDSKIYSCFDIMHQLLTSDRIPADKKITTTQESPAEIIFAKVVLTPLIEEEFVESNLDYVFQYPLSHLFKRGVWLTDNENAFIGRDSHVDFLVFSKVTHRPVFGIEVDGKTYHEKGSIQRQRDLLKDSIFLKSGLPLYRFRTDQSSEVERLQAILSKYTRNLTSLSDVINNVSH